MAFSSEEKNLILIQSLYFFVGALADIFITVFFFSLGTMRTPLVFQLVRMVVFMFFYSLYGLVFKKYASSTIIKIGLITLAAFYLLLFLLKQHSITYLIPLSVLNGFAIASFWSGYNLNQYILTSQKKRISYFGSTLVATQLLQAIAPFLGGSIITMGTLYASTKVGYGFLFLCISIILIIITIFVGKLPYHEPLTFSLSHIFSHTRSRIWKKVLVQHFLLGMYDLPSGTVVGILIYLIVKGEFLLGISQTVTVLLSIVGSLLAIRLLHKSSRFYWIGIGGLAIGFCVFGLFQTQLGVLLYILLTALTSPFVNTWMPTFYYKTLDEISGHYREKYHLLIERDVALELGRILSYTLMFVLIQPANQVMVARYALFLFPISILFLGFALREKRTAF